MNEFTKEELLFLYGILSSQWLENLPIGNKLQGIIDNYCEHEFVPYKEEVCSVPLCSKCNMIVL